MSTKYLMNRQLKVLWHFIKEHELKYRIDINNKVDVFVTYPE